MPKVTAAHREKADKLVANFVALQLQTSGSVAQDTLQRAITLALAEADERSVDLVAGRNAEIVASRKRAEDVVKAAEVMRDNTYCLSEDHGSSSVCTGCSRSFGHVKECSTPAFDAALAEYREGGR